MQMLNQKQNNNKKRKTLRKSQLLLIGSFLVFVGIFVISYNHLLFLKDQVFANMELAILESKQSDEEEEIDVPTVDNVSDGTTYEETNKEIDYSKYLGVLEIPKIGLKRGFYNTDSKYISVVEIESILITL